MTGAPVSNAGVAERLAALVGLERRARACTDADQLAFLMVNDSHALVPYRQAVLWQGGPVTPAGRILALSGLAVPERDAPFNVWMAALLARHAASPAGRRAGPMTRPLAVADAGADAHQDAAMWAEHLPAHAWWMPLCRAGGDGGPAEGLLLLRETPWQAAEAGTLELLADAYAHAWQALQKPAASRGRAARLRAWRAGLRGWRWRWGAAVLSLLVLACPLRQTVLAPAEIVARAPEAVRAPLPGVVDHIDVQPNQAVQPGQLLAALDARELQGRLEAARQALAVAEAELRQGQQQALFDDRSKAGLALLQGKRDQALADRDYFAQAVARTQLRAERAGIALFDDPADWIGRPVALGERIMWVADPADVELEVLLPVADAVTLPPAARVRLFLHSAPTTPLEAELVRVGYRAAPTPDGTLAFRVRARLSAGAADAPAALRRVGLKGTAKLYGERTVLAAYLLRRPLAAARLWLGL